MGQNVIFVLVQRYAVGALRNLPLVEILKEIHRECVHSGGYGIFLFRAVFVYVMQFFNKFSLGFVQIVGLDRDVVSVAPIADFIIPIILAASALADVCCASFCSEFFSESFRHR